MERDAAVERVSTLESDLQSQAESLKEANVRRILRVVISDSNTSISSTSIRMIAVGFTINVGTLPVQKLIVSGFCYCSVGSIKCSRARTFSCELKDKAAGGRATRSKRSSKQPARAGGIMGICSSQIRRES
jgi:hypothetical protein